MPVLSQNPEKKRKKTVGFTVASCRSKIRHFISSHADGIHGFSSEAQIKG